MARNLDKHSGLNYTPASGLSPLLPLQDANWSPWAGNQPAPFPSLPNSNRLPRITISSPESTLQPARQSIAASSTGPILTIPTIPTVATLQPNVPNIHDPTFDPALKVAWVRDVLSLVERTVKTPEPPVPAVIRDFALLRLAQVAIKTLLQIANSETQPLPPYVVEAIFLRGKLTWHGTHPKQVPLNPRAAVRDFKTAAKAGYAPAWFFRGIYYENIKMASRALQCFKRGMELGDAMSMFVRGDNNVAQS
ncbi:hypothetical protein DXG03_003756 [Asterophora parasitica]|uniref:Uncharacterized protein n=1 Tax=Asterophora parasitica TaxID=117018 RepID=A0A9P7KAL7_9AGAR|nr:hypothetical protein DXG03_003756 [Asterophora parasitica]